MVKVWDPETETCLHTLQGHTNRVYSLQFDGAYVVSGSLDTSIRVWDVVTGGCVHTLTGHQSLTSGMELKNNILVSGNADSTVRVWDIRTGQCLHTLQGEVIHTIYTKVCGHPFKLVDSAFSATPVADRCIKSST
uniref:Uncharacterized protein n=1 Tax=Hucho hucho TaxID=62062 RepID=A0A4W5KT87_9TELE